MCVCVCVGVMLKLKMGALLSTYLYIFLATRDEASAMRSTKVELAGTMVRAFARWYVSVYLACPSTTIYSSPLHDCRCLLLHNLTLRHIMRLNPADHSL